MALFAKQPIHCPACGTLHEERLDQAPLASVPGIELCCDKDCRDALGLAHTRYVVGEKAPNSDSPFSEFMILREMKKRT